MSVINFGQHGNSAKGILTAYLATIYGSDIKHYPPGGARKQFLQLQKSLATWVQTTVNFHVDGYVSMFCVMGTDHYFSSVFRTCEQHEYSASDA